MTLSKTWRFDYFVGADVSKETLDFGLYHRNRFIGHYKIGNNPVEIRKLIRQLKADHGLKVARSVFGMENTGFYCNHLLQVLAKIRANAVLEDSVHIQKTLGRTRGKTDMMDAKRIAGYLLKSRDSLKMIKVRRPVIDELGRLNTLRSRLVSIQGSLRHPLKEEKSFMAKSISSLNSQLCGRTIASIALDIAELDSYMRKLWASDGRVARLMQVITSVPGVGEVTALHIIVCTNELLSFDNARKFACYCGVAPFPHQSGTSVNFKTRVSHMSNRKMKSLLHTCAMTSIRHVPEFKEYYLRRTETDGKPKMSVINAIRFKLIMRIFTCVSQDRVYKKEYVHN